MCFIAKMLIYKYSDRMINERLSKARLSSPNLQNFGSQNMDKAMRSLSPLSRMTTDDIK